MLGGIEKIIKKYFEFITDVMVRQIFMNNILADLFFIKVRKEHDEEGELKDALSNAVSIANDNDLHAGKSMLKASSNKFSETIMGGKSDHRFVTAEEDKHYMQLKRKLEKKNIDTDDVNFITAHMFANRTKYQDYIHMGDLICDMIKNMLGPLKPFIACKCRRKFSKGSEDYKRDKRYLHGVKRYNTEMDII